MKDFLKYTVLPVLAIYFFLFGTFEVSAQIQVKEPKNKYSSICASPIANGGNNGETKWEDTSKPYWKGQDEVLMILDKPSLSKLGKYSRIKAKIIEGFRIWEKVDEKIPHFIFFDGKCDYNNKDGINCVMAADIDCRGTVRDGHDYLGVCRKNIKNDGIRDADILLDTLDDDEINRFFFNRFKLLSVVIHEVGHLLGFTHSLDKTSVMYFENNGLIKLSKYDIKRAQRVYGVAKDSDTGGDKNE